MSRLQEIFAYIEEMEGYQGSEESHAFVAEIQGLFRNPEEVAWLKNQIGSLSGQATAFLQIMSLEAKFPEELIIHLRDWIALHPPSSVHCSMTLLLALQGDSFGLNFLENYLYLEKRIRHPATILEAFMALHSEEAKAIIERCCRDTSDRETRSRGQEYLKRWNDPGTHRCSFTFDSDWED